MEGGSDQLGEFLASDFGAEGFETYIGAPARRGVGQGITKDLADILSADGKNVLNKNRPAKAIGKAFGGYFQTYLVPFAQIVDVQRAIGYRGTLKKDVSKDPAPPSEEFPYRQIREGLTSSMGKFGEGTYEFFRSAGKEFVRPFNQQAMFMTPEEEASLPVRTDLYGRDDRLKNLERALLGLNFEELPNESGKFLQSLGIKGFKISSRSKIPTIKREENKFIIKYLPSIVQNQVDSTPIYKKRYQQALKAKPEIKNTLSEEAFIKEEMKEETLKEIRSLKANFEPTFKDVPEEKKKYLIALEEYRKLSKGDRKRANNTFVLQRGYPPRIYNAKDILFLKIIAEDMRE